MEYLKKLEVELLRLWQQANEANSPTKRGEALEAYYKLYGSYRRQKEYVEAMGVSYGQ
jgi:hypothetical protein